MGDVRAKLTAAAKADGRYAVEAYEFLCMSLAFTQKALGREPPEDADDPAAALKDKHVSVRELLEGFRQMAVEQFGRMAFVVLGHWGVRTTGDVGEMVFNLIRHEVWFGSAADRREDFDDVFDFRRAFLDEFRLPKEEW